MSKNTNIIIKGKHQKHESHGGHGVWKIAYADFMTALMAFFLMMWLTSSMPENIRKGIANYFASIGASSNVTGTSAVLDGGDSLEDIGNLEKVKLEESIFISATTHHSSPKTKVDQEDNNIKAGGSEVENKEEKEQRVLKAAQRALQEAIERNPILKQISDNIITSITHEGLKIELIDKSENNMFEIGSKQLLDGMKTALAQITKVIQMLPNKVNITGHTDSRPYGATASYNNWNLSTDRALEAMRFLVMAGFPESKVAGVVGKASNELLDPEKPLSPSNRRISILVLRNAVLSGEKKQ